MGRVKRAAAARNGPPSSSVSVRVRGPIRTAFLAANIALLFLYPVALRGWIAQKFTYYEPEMIGASTFAWSMFAIAAIVSVVAARRLPRARWVAIGLIAVLLLIVLDQAAGARRNDQISAEGVVVGWTMVLQVAALAASTLLADPLPTARRGWDGRHLVAVVLVVVALAAVLTRLHVPSPEEFPPPDDAPIGVPAAPPDLQPSGKTAWTGHELDFRNWTTLPLFLLNERGERAGVGACARIGLDGFTGQVTIRAERGYVATFGWGPSQGGERTTFVVLLPHEIYLDASPPAAPLPPCHGKPQVQEGI